jgi:hypothetical protein
VIANHTLQIVVRHAWGDLQNRHNHMLYAVTEDDLLRGVLTHAACFGGGSCPRLAAGDYPVRIVDLALRAVLTTARRAGSETTAAVPFPLLSRARPRSLRGRTYRRLLG